MPLEIEISSVAATKPSHCTLGINSTCALFVSNIVIVKSPKEGDKMNLHKSMSMKFILGLAFLTLSWEYGMTHTKIFQPKPLEGMQKIPASNKSKRLDREVTTFLRNKYSIQSARYFLVPEDIKWISISKSVQNQMLEKSIQRAQWNWHKPGIDFIDVYLQNNNTVAFAIAMPKESPSNEKKLVGFYLLKSSTNR